MKAARLSGNKLYNNPYLLSADFYKAVKKGKKLAKMIKIF